MASGWNLWVWLECIGVISRCCKELGTVYIDILIIIITFPTPLILSLFWQQHPYFFVHFKNVFSFLFMLFLCDIANVAQRTFEIVQKSSSQMSTKVQTIGAIRIQLYISGGKKGCFSM